MGSFPSTCFSAATFSVWVVAASIVMCISSAAIAQPASLPATSPSAETQLSARIDDALAKAGVFLGNALSGGHGEATALPPVGPAAAPPWGLATASAGETMMHAGWGEPVAVKARKWLATAPVSAEAAPTTVLAVRFWGDEHKQRAYQLTDKLNQTVTQFAIGNGPATDAELVYAAQCTDAVLWMLEPGREQYRARRDPPWDALVQRFLALQRPNGAWGAEPQTTARCIDTLHRLMTHKRTGISRRDAEKATAAIDRGVASLGDVSLNTASFATLDAIAVAAIDVGLQYVGRQDWFLAGATSLLSRQNPDGSFGDATNHQQRIIDTSHAFRFLLRGRECLAFGRFENGSTSRRPELQQRIEMSHLAASTGRDLCRYATWERVSVRTSLDDLSDLPVIVIAGNGKLEFTDAEAQLLRRYTDRGGLLLCVADQSNAVTVASFQKLASQAFPELGLRELPPEHPMLDVTLSPLATPKAWLRNLPVNTRFLGVSNGIREMMIVVRGADPAGAWFRNDERRDHWAFDLASIVMIYGCMERLATGDETRAGRYDRPSVGTPLPPGSRAVEVVTYNPTLTSFPEPYAWTRMAKILNADGVALSASPADLATLDARRQSLLHICGAGSFKLKEAEREAIATFAKSGGTVLIEAASADPRFIQSAKAELLPSLGFAADTLPGDFELAIVSGQTGGPGKLRFRVSGKKAGETALSSLTLDGRPAIIFCSGNLCLGMADIGTCDIFGFDTKSSTRIVRHLVLSLK